MNTIGTQPHSPLTKIFLKSDQINELAAALAKAQGEYTVPIKDLFNPHFGQPYPSLSSLIKATRPALSKYGLSIVQLLSSTQDALHVTTILMHSSGQYLGDVLSLKPDRLTPQGFGSAATYAKRYSYGGITGTDAEQDDDGNLASGIGDEVPESHAQSKAKPDLSAQSQKKTTKQDLSGHAQTQDPPPQKQYAPNPAKAGEVISEKQDKRLFAISNKLGWTLDEIKYLLKTKYGVEHVRDIKRGDYEAICNILEYQKPEQVLQKKPAATTSVNNLASSLPYAPLPDESSMPMEFEIPF